MSPSAQARSTNGTASIATSGVVLAGGRSSRFGRDKLAERLEGSPILHHALRAVGAVCDEIIVVAAAEGPAPELPNGFRRRTRVVRDPEPFPGPLSALATGLEAATNQLVLVTGGDMPCLVPEVLELLLRTASAEDLDAISLEDGETEPPLPCAVRRYHRRTARALMDEGNASLRALLAAVGAARIPERTWSRLDPQRGSLVDVDVPADLPG